MSTFTIYARKHKQVIQSVEDWRRWGGPQSDHQWQDAYSAKECAKAWFRKGPASVPIELVDLFRSHSLTSGLTIRSVLPEVETKLDAFRGKGRVHDLVLLADGPAGSTLVAIEAKARESFGPTIDRAHAQSLQRPGSNAAQRIEQLTQAIFGRPLDNTLRSLRYQLVHAVAGTVIQARQERARLAVFVIHEFVSDTKLATSNHADLQRFLRLLPGDKAAMTLGLDPFLDGPYHVPGGEYVPGDMPLLIGRVSAPSSS
ncbi:MAG TPA: hypothetical protein VGD69_14465 [Herpetosiphonaceae bacterium]